MQTKGNTDMSYLEMYYQRKELLKAFDEVKELFEKLDEIDHYLEENFRKLDNDTFDYHLEERDDIRNEIKRLIRIDILDCLENWQYERDNYEKTQFTA